MGKKISVDSANLMNKVLEIIEASLIFKLSINKFKILIHPQSLIHAVLQLNNGLSSMLYHHNDMKIPIINSLYNNLFSIKKIDEKFLTGKELSFSDIDLKKYPSVKILKLKKILNETGYILINTINEVLVQRFLENKISFTDIINKLLVILNSKLVRKYLKIYKIRHINDVFKVYNFSRSIVN